MINKYNSYVLWYGSLLLLETGTVVNEISVVDLYSPIDLVNVYRTYLPRRPAGHFPYYGCTAEIVAKSSSDIPVLNPLNHKRGLTSTPKSAELSPR